MSAVLGVTSREAGLTVAVIPARGGSKSIPGKNIAELGGKPLLAWSIDVARTAEGIDRVVVSTDDSAIAQVAEEYGAEVDMRPAHLATDTALVIDALRELLGRWRETGTAVRTLILLEPTCPFRSAGDIEECLARLDDDSVDSVATFKPAELNPLRAWRVDDGRPMTFIEGANPWVPRQALPNAYQLNGAVYAFRADRLTDAHGAILFGNAAAVIMPPERSVDIDNPFDLLVARQMLGGESVGA